MKYSRWDEMKNNKTNNQYSCRIDRSHVEVVEVTRIHITTIHLYLVASQRMNDRAWCRCGHINTQIHSKTISPLTKYSSFDVISIEMSYKSSTIHICDLGQANLLRCNRWNGKKYNDHSSYLKYLAFWAPLTTSYYQILAINFSQSAATNEKRITHGDNRTLISTHLTEMSACINYFNSLTFL